MNTNEWLKKRSRFLRIAEIEDEIKCPRYTLTKFISGERSLPEKWVGPFKEFMLQFFYGEGKSEMIGLMKDEANIQLVGGRPDIVDGTKPILMPGEEVTLGTLPAGTFIPGTPGGDVDLKELEKKFVDPLSIPKNDFAEKFESEKPTFQESTSIRSIDGKEVISAGPGHEHATYEEAIEKIRKKRKSRKKEPKPKLTPEMIAGTEPVPEEIKKKMGENLDRMIELEKKHNKPFVEAQKADEENMMPVTLFNEKIGLRWLAHPISVQKREDTNEKRIKKVLTKDGWLYEIIKMRGNLWMYNYCTDFVVAMNMK